MAKFTFKRTRETGLMAVGHPYPTVEIKLKRKVVGIIEPPCWSSPDNLWRLRFTVDKDDGRDWKWIRLKKTFASEADARDWLTAMCDEIQTKLKLHPIDDD